MKKLMRYVRNVIHHAEEARKIWLFLACHFPTCRNAKTIPIAPCPADGCTGKIIARKKGARGKEFYGCTRYPDCDFVTWHKPTGELCPICSKMLIEKSDKERGHYKACIIDACEYNKKES